MYKRLKMALPLNILDHMKRTFYPTSFGLNTTILSVYAESEYFSYLFKLNKSGPTNENNKLEQIIHYL